MASKKELRDIMRPLKEKIKKNHLLGTYRQLRVYHERLKQRMVEIYLENHYLRRRVEQLELKLKIANGKGNNHHSFAQIGTKYKGYKKYETM